MGSNREMGIVTGVLAGLKGAARWVTDSLSSDVSGVLGFRITDG